MGKTASRIEWVDIAKGMSIILIVLGHSFLSSIPLVGDWCAAFMIPFFFFVSGLLFKPGKDLKTFAKKKWLGLLRPFIFFSAIVLIGYFCISVDVGKNRLNTLHYGWQGYALWFIPILFLTNMLYYFLCRLLENKIHRLLGIIVLGFTGYFSYIYYWSNYWNVNFSFTAVFFYGLGNLLQPFLTKVFNRPNMHVILLATICLILSVGFMFNHKPEFFINHLGKGGITHLVGVAGAVFMCCVAVLLSRSTHPVINLCKSGLKYFGKNSYVLLAFHQIIIMLFLSLLPGMPKILMHTFMWLTVVILIELITRRFPFILGREKKKEKSEVPCS